MLSALKLVRERLDSLLRVVAAIRNGPTLAACAEEALNECLPVLGARAGSILLLTGEAHTLERVAAVGDSAEGDVPEPISEITLAGRPLFLPSPTKGAHAIVPLFVDRTLIGVLELDYPTDREFSEAEQAFILAVADQCALALERVRFYDDLAQTAHQAREESLRREAARLRRIVETSPDCIETLDLAGHLISINQGGRVALEIEDFDRYRGVWWPSLWKDEHHLAAVAALEMARSGKGARFHGCCSTARGRMRWWDVTVTPLSNPGERVEEILCISRDVTPTMEAANAVRLSEERFRSLAEATALVIWTASADGVVDMNIPGWREFTGRSADEMRGVRWLDTIHPDDRVRTEEALARSVRTGEIYDIEHRVRRRDGVYRRLRSRAVPVHNGDGTIREWIGTSNDVTDLREAEEARIRQAERDHQIAQTLQESLLPLVAPDSMPGFALQAVHLPLLDEATVGGDFYDAFPLSGGKYALVVGDVMGKGLAAALSIAEVRFALRGFLRESPDADPGEALGRLNRFLMEAQQLEDRPRHALVALTLAVVDTATGEVTASAAGAYPALILRPSTRRIRHLRGGDLILGAFYEARYSVVHAVLRPGDLLLLTTDGIPEARSPQGSRLFGQEGMERVLRHTSVRADGLAQIGRTIVDQARDFSGGIFRDDICLLLAMRTDRA